MAHTVLPEKIQRNLLNWRWIDAIHRWRARDVLRKSQIHRYLPKAGLMLEQLTKTTVYVRAVSDIWIYEEIREAFLQGHCTPAIELKSSAAR